jgi:hypothetical protein
VINEFVESYEAAEGPGLGIDQWWMRLVDRMSPAHRLRSGALHTEQVIRIACSLLHALDYLTEKGSRAST